MIKAVYLERITRFVTWPAGDDMLKPDKPFVIGVVGPDPFEGLLEKVFVDHRIKGKPVVIQHFPKLNGLSALRGCHLLFLTGLSEYEVNRVIATTDGAAILTVSDTPGYEKRGVMVNLVPEDEHLRFLVNIEAAEDAGLEMSYLFLKRAMIVSAGPP